MILLPKINYMRLAKKLKKSMAVKAFLQITDSLKGKGE
jgi:hypothetical protein